MDIIIDYTGELTVPEPVSISLSPAEQAYLDRILLQADKLGNQGTNISENLEKEISTKDFVEQYLREINEARSQEWLKQQEEISEKLNEPDFRDEIIPETSEIEMDDYTGPSNIQYEFLEPPFDRYKIYLPVPVYKCKGEGLVTVSVTVDQAGIVTSAISSVEQENPDRECLLEVARNYALKTRFEGDFSAPRLQKAKIIYHFIPQ